MTLLIYGSIFPGDWRAVSQIAVAKTGRVLIVNEDTEVTNYGEHLFCRIIDEHFYELLAEGHEVLMGLHVMPGIGLNSEYAEQNMVPQSPWRFGQRTKPSVMEEA